MLAACGGGSGAGGAGSSPAAGTPGMPTAGTGTAASPGASPGAISVRSPAFGAGTAIPARFTCHGSNTPVPLTWAGVPPRAQSVAVVVDDPDAPGGTFTHWVVFNLPGANGGTHGGAHGGTHGGTQSGITGGHLPAGAAQAQNSNGRAAYFGPCPPSGTHHYRFTVYAEPGRLELPAGAPLTQALRAITADALASGRLTGLVSA